MQGPVERRCLSASRSGVGSEPPDCRDCPGGPWAEPLSASLCPPQEPAPILPGRQQRRGPLPTNALGTAAGPLVHHLLAAGGLRGPSLWPPHPHGPLATQQSHTLRTLRCWRRPGRTPRGRQGGAATATADQAPSPPDGDSSAFSTSGAGTGGRRRGKGHATQQRDKGNRERGSPRSQRSLLCTTRAPSSRAVSFVRCAPRRPFPTALCFA